MFQQFANHMTEVCNPIIEHIVNQRHLKAIRDALSPMITWFIIISVFMLMVKFELINPVYGLELPFIFMMSGIGLGILILLAKEMGKVYECDSHVNIMLSILIYIMLLKDTFRSMQASRFVVVSIGLALLLPILHAEILRLFEKLKLQKHMEHFLPELVVSNVYSFLPALCLTAIWYLFYFVIRCPIPDFVYMLLEPFVWFSNSIFAILIIVIMTCLFWAIGVHGVNVIAMLFRPFWYIILCMNMAAVLFGEEPQMIGTELFFQWYVWLGGSGTTIGLAILMRFFTKSKHCLQIGKTSIRSAFCNVNEPLIFGIPIVMNPMMMIPFIMTPLLCTIIAYAGIVLGIIPPLYLCVPWTFPAPLGAFLASGCDLRALACSLGFICISVVIYYPFVRYYDQKQRKLEENKKS